VLRYPGQRGIDATNIQDIQLIVIPWVDSYNEPGDWIPGNGFTFQIGDIILVGEHDFDITGVQPWREKDVLNKFAHCFSIRSIRDNTRDRHGKHWVVEGI